MFGSDGHSLPGVVFAVAADGAAAFVDVHIVHSFVVAAFLAEHLLIHFALDHAGHLFHHVAVAALASAVAFPVVVAALTLAAVVALSFVAVALAAVVVVVAVMALVAAVFGQFH